MEEGIDSQVDGSSSDIEDAEQLKPDAQWEQADWDYEKRKIDKWGICSDEEIANIINIMMESAMKASNRETINGQEPAEAREARPLPNPQNSTKNDIELHNLTRLCFQELVQMVHGR